MRAWLFLLLCGHVVTVRQGFLRGYRPIGNRLCGPWEEKFGAALPANSVFFIGTGHENRELRHTSDLHFEIHIDSHNRWRKRIVLESSGQVSGTDRGWRREECRHGGSIGFMGKIAMHDHDLNKKGESYQHNILPVSVADDLQISTGWF